MDTAYWLNLLGDILTVIVPLVLLAGGILIKNYLTKKGATEEHLELLNQAYTLLTRAVTGTNQVWVDALKAAGNGLTEEQQAEARKKTEEAFKAMLTDTVQLAIETAYGSVEKWLDINLEPAVGAVKHGAIIE